MIFCGIDPGMSGGVAWIEQMPDPTNLIKVQAEKFCDKTAKDIFEIFTDRIMGERGLGQNFTAVIEAVHSMPKQGVSSSFKFGMNYGMLQGFLYALGIQFVYVSPQKWQKYMGCLTHGDKNVSKSAAQRLFPHMKITHAIADALLLAEYCRRTSFQAHG